MEIKVMIDFDRDPTIKNARQVVYMNGVYTTMDSQNIIGKYITAISYHEDTGCLVLTLDEKLPEIEGEKNE